MPSSEGEYRSVPYDVSSGITLGDKTFKALEWTDGQLAEMRSCVHELGYEPVRMMANLGLKPNQIRAIVHACWSSPRTPSQMQSFGKTDGERQSRVLQHMDTLLQRAEAGISALMLLSFLKRHGMTVVPIEPSQPMISASMATVANHDMVLTKTEKHKLRLREAISASMARMWPGL